MKLPNNCSIGKMSVHPKNWETPQADLSIEWYLHYRFFDPRYKSSHPHGCAVKIRGMNDRKDLRGRRRITKQMLEEEVERLNSGWNPIKGKTVAEVVSPLIIPPTTPFADALERAYPLLPETGTKKEVGKALVHMLKAIADLGHGDICIKDVEQCHLELLLMQVGKNKVEEYKKLEKNPPVTKTVPRPSRVLKQKKQLPKEWGAEAFNHYRSYLLMLFKLLKKIGATKIKPAEDIEKRKGPKPQRTGFTPQDFDKINTLKANYYTFWRLIWIFHRSGAREVELMGVQKEHVDLDNRRFHVLLKKGRGQWEWIWKTITRDVFHLWEEIYSDAQPGQYLFSHDLRPGPMRISQRQITKRWKWHVKEKLGIQADFYELKHENTTKVISLELRKIEQASQVAAGINGHKGTVMSRKVYDLEGTERLHRQLKDI